MTAAETLTAAVALAVVLSACRGASNDSRRVRSLRTGPRPPTSLARPTTSGTAGSGPHWTTPTNPSSPTL